MVGATGLLVKMNKKHFIVVNPVVNWFPAMILIGVALVNAFLVQRMREALNLEEWHANGLSPDTGD